MGLLDNFESVNYSRFIQDRYQRPDVLSETWQELLGANSAEVLAMSGEGVMPTMPAAPVTVIAFDDPWDQLLHVQGVEMVDLQQVRLDAVQVAFSDVEVEQALQIMQEQSTEENGRG